MGVGKKRKVERKGRWRERAGDNREKTCVLSVPNAPVELKIGIGTVAP